MAYFPLSFSAEPLLYLMLTGHLFPRPQPDVPQMGSYYIIHIVGELSGVSGEMWTDNLS